MAAETRSQRQILVAFGAIMLATLLSALDQTAILLAAGWGGTSYAWDSTQVIAAAAIGVAGLATFGVIERHVREPLLPLGLFRSRTFAVSTAASLLIGGVLFGITIYVPVYVQRVLGASATSSGVILIPLSFGWVAASMASGQFIARTGRYKAFPVLGSLLVLAGCVLSRCSTRPPMPSSWRSSRWPP